MSRLRSALPEANRHGFRAIARPLPAFGRTPPSLRDREDEKVALFFRPPDAKRGEVARSDGGAAR
jgi:hypothetical protein